jgi:hypothetical protein
VPPEPVPNLYRPFTVRTNTCTPSVAMLMWQDGCTSLATQETEADDTVGLVNSTRLKARMARSVAPTWTRFRDTQMNAATNSQNNNTRLTEKCASGAHFNMTYALRSTSRIWPRARANNSAAWKSIRETRDSLH